MSEIQQDRPNSYYYPSPRPNQLIRNIRDLPYHTASSISITFAADKLTTIGISHTRISCTSNSNLRADRITLRWNKEHASKDPLFLNAVRAVALVCPYPPPRGHEAGLANGQAFGYRAIFPWGLGPRMRNSKIEISPAEVVSNRHALACKTRNPMIRVSEAKWAIRPHDLGEL